MVILCNPFVYGSTLFEKEQAREKILMLKERIKAVENAYKVAMQKSLDEIERNELTTAYYQNRIELFQHIAQQREIINEPSRQQWLWDMAKIIGPIAMLSFAAYQFFKSPPIADQSLALNQQPEAPEVFLSTQEPLIQGMLSEQTVMPPTQQPLTKEEYEKYKKAARKFGNTTLFLVGTLFLTGNPALYPFIAASYVGTWYSAMKALKLPQLHPVALEEITIIPPELPY